MSVDERKTELKALIKQKQALETLYTPDYPDVVAISGKIADLQAEIAHASAEPAPSFGRGGIYRQAARLAAAPTA